MSRLLAGALLLAAVSRGETSVQHLWESKQHAKIRALDESLNGVLGVATIDLTSGRVYVYNGDAVFPTASSIKIAIMIQMFRDERAGKFHFTDQKILGPTDYAGGSSGPISDAIRKGPATFPIRELMEQMILYSDNSATNKCIDLTGMENVNRLLTGFGLRSTRLRRKMMDSAAVARGDENVSTPLELARLMEMIYRGTAADAASSKAMLDLLKGVKAGMRGAIPAGIEVAAKPGELPGVHCEVGAVLLPGRPFILNVMSTFLSDGANPVGPVTSIVLDHFQRIARSSVYGRGLP